MSGAARKVALALAGVAVLSCVAQQPAQRTARSSTARAEAGTEFLAVASVLQSPRCRNCHPGGGQPLQGDAGEPHTMNVRRGADGRGTPALRCTACHQASNTAGVHTPPGAPDWRLPPPDRPMVFAGLDAAELCRNLKDPAKNGRRSLTDLREHLASDAIVNWAWAPGDGRAVPPLSHADLVAAFDRWVQAGAGCPSPGIHAERSASR